MIVESSPNDENLFMELGNSPTNFLTVGRGSYAMNINIKIFFALYKTKTAQSNCRAVEKIISLSLIDFDASREFFVILFDDFVA